MLEFLKALAARFLQRGPDWLVPPSADPYAGVRVPRRRGPGGRSSAVAVDEPPPESSVRAHAGAVHDPRAN